MTSVNGTELVITILLSVVLLGVACYFGYRQVLALRGAASPEALGADDRRFTRSQAYRRLFCSFLMVVFSGLLIGWLFLDPTYRTLHEDRLAQAAEDPAAPLTDQQREALGLFSLYWIAALFVLLVLVSMAALDFWATTRYGFDQHRRLKADHRAFIEEQVARRRRDRNGQH
jgi:MFS family permease